MNRIVLPLSLALITVAWLPGWTTQEAPETQGPPTQVVVIPPSQEHHWDTVLVKNRLPLTLLTVPSGKDFVLTDLWTMQDDSLPGKASPEDRLWVESVDRERRRVVLDGLLSEVTALSGGTKLQWATGPVFGPDTQIVVQYSFKDRDNHDLVRRLHFSGYFKDHKRAEAR